MARAFETKPGRAPLPAAAQRPAAPTRTVPPAADFPQLARRLHLGAPIQRRAGASPGRDFSNIAGPGRPTLPGGLPAGLRADVEARSGLPMDDVRVHRNSPRPRAIDALAYAQGRDIHLGPGQERHLPHEAWHVVQQKQGRVRATLQVGNVAINDDAALERDASVMAQRADRPQNPSVDSIEGNRLAAPPLGSERGACTRVAQRFKNRQADPNHVDIVNENDLATLRDWANRGEATDWEDETSPDDAERALLAGRIAQLERQQRLGASAHQLAEFDAIKADDNIIAGCAKTCASRNWDLDTILNHLAAASPAGKTVAVAVLANGDVMDERAIMTLATQWQNLQNWNNIDVDILVELVGQKACIVTAHKYSVGAVHRQSNYACKFYANAVQKIRIDPEWHVHIDDHGVAQNPGFKSKANGKVVGPHVRAVTTSQQTAKLQTLCKI